MTTRYVNTASTAGGDGTTNATSGANRAYASLAEWEAAEQATLTEDHTVLCAGAINDTECTIDGWIPSGFRVIVAGNTGDAAGAHAGKWDTAFYTIGSTSGTSAAIVPIEENVTIQDIQATNSNTGGGGLGRFGVVGNDLIIQRCVLKGPGTGGTSTGLLVSDTSNLRTKVLNNIAHDWNIGMYMRGTATPGANACVAANNTFTQNAVGFQGRGGGPRAVNNLTFGNTADMGRAASDWDETNCFYNAFGNSGTLVPGSTDIDLSAYAATDLFLDNANEDFHLLSSGSAYASVDNNGVGPDSNTDVPDDDIDGDTRSGTTTSVGADIIVSGGTTIAIGVGTLTLTGYAQTLNSQILVSSNSILVTGFSPTVLTNTRLDIGVGSLVFTGYDSSSDFSLRIANGALTLTGYAAGLQDYLSIGVGTLTLSGFAPSIVESTLLPIDLGQLSLTGYNLTLDNQFDFGSIASIILTGYDLSLSTGAQTIAIGVGELLLSNYAPQLVVTAIEVPLAEITVTGYAIQFNSGIGIGSADTLLTGLAPSLQTDIPILYGALSISGFAPDLVTSTSSIDINLGQLSFSGYAISLITGYPTVDIGVGTLALTSYAIGIEQLLLIRNTDLRSDAALTSQRPDATLTNQRLDVTLTSKRTST